MKNLIHLGERRRKLVLDLASDASQKVVDICHVLTDDGSSTSDTVVLTEDGILSKVSSSGKAAWVCNLNDVQEGGGWFNVAYIDPELVCLSRNGAIVTVSPGAAEAELVGVFDHGLEAASWSPDSEVLLMVSSSDDDGDESGTKSVLMAMNTQFEVLVEIDIPRYVASSTGEAMGTSVAWRPDGTLCTVSSVDQADKIRKIRIYKRETLELHAIGRTEDASGTLVKNLQDSGLAWSGAGCSQILAAVQRKGKKTQQVVFFESNGLRHRELVLREAPTTKVTSLAWNFTSDLLGVALREESLDKVQLWHRCNYHWYLKKEFRYPGQRVQKIKFHEERSSDFSILLENLEWREYEVRWDPSTTIQLGDMCPAFVVDGCSLNITPLDKALIPPPMSMNIIILDQPINDVCFCHPKHRSGALLVCLSDGSLGYLHPDEGGRPSNYKTQTITWKDTRGIDILSLRSFVVVGSETSTLKVVAVSCASENKICEQLVEIVLSDIDTAEASGRITEINVLQDRVLRLSQWADDSSGCLVQLENGSLFEFQEGASGTRMVPSEAEPFLEPCPWMCAVKDATVYSGGDHDVDGHSRLVFGLSARRRLYFHDMMLTDSASSLYLSLSHEFLCYATAGSRCQVRFLPLKEVNGFDPLMGMEHNHLREGYEPRDVERGARLVAILPGHSMAILQMPRGNLEGIYPRALVLRDVMTKISEEDYGEAFRMMRKHKVDLNLIVDLDPLEFLNRGISKFVDHVTNIDHLNLFISSLQDWDITKSRFPIPTWFRQKNIDEKKRQSFDFASKTNQVCTKARDIMIEKQENGSMSESYFLLPILSTFAKQTPPKLDQALSLIKCNALKNHPETSKKNPLFSDQAQKSIHYLAFLAEYKLLFDTALGMYDNEIARGVARNSQMDPKVYLPLLKRLNALPPFYSRYEVDIRLKRYENALSNLFESFSRGENLEGVDRDIVKDVSLGNTFDNCTSLIEQHKLYKSGLELFQGDQEKTRVILLSLGESLLSEHKPQAALSVYLAATPPSLEGAKRAARAANDWRCYFSVMESEGRLFEDATEEQKENEAERRRHIAREIASEVVEAAGTNGPKFKQMINVDAARILLDYGNDLLGAVDTLVDACCWQEAHRVAACHSREDLIKKTTDAAVSYAYTAMDHFRDKAESFDTTNTRYAEVLKLRKKNVFLQGPDLTTEADETGSLFSSASNVSNMSLQSNTSISSTGSGISSVISVKSTSTFTMTGEEEVNRHRSKFNKGKKKKKAKKRRGRGRRKPGSEEELKELEGLLKVTCADSEYAEMIGETIQFLIFVQHLSLASEVYKGYNVMKDTISKSQKDRIETALKEKAEAERNSRLEGETHEDTHMLLVLPREKDIDALQCASIPQSLADFFNYY